MSRIVVHTSEPSSGAARYVNEFVAGLAAHTADVTLFCPPAFDFIHEVRATGANVVLAAHRRVEPAGIFVRLIRNVGHAIGSTIKQLTATERGDIVHFQFPLYFPAGLAYFAVARWKGCSIVFTAHDPVPHKWLLPRKLRLLEWNMLRLAYSLSDRIIVHNDAGRQVVVREFGQHPDKVAVIPHGPLRLPDTNHEDTNHERVEPAPSGPLRLLLFGGIRENKGVHLAIEAVQSLNSAGVPVELTIAGAAANARESSYWEKCRQLVDLSADGIKVIDRYIENSEIGPLIRQHHALLLPYLDYVSESGVAALALANQRAIIATRAGGLGALLSEAPCGIAIEENTADAVAHAIVKAREAGPDSLRKMGEAGSALMDSGRSWVDIGRRTLAVYDAIRAERHAAEMPLRSLRSGGPGRILILITTLTFGGAETQVVQLALELNRRGWLVKIACMIDPDAYVSQLTDAHIEVVSLGMPKGIPDPRAIWRLRSFISEFKPDVVHCHMVHANLLGRISRLFCRMPALICTAHNLREASEKGGPTWHKELLYRLTDSLADRTTIICGAAFDRYVKVRAVPAKKFEMIPNGIDTLRFSPETERRESARESLGVGKEFVWLAVGRLVEQKNYSGLLRALTMLPQKGWVLLVAGNGPLLSELQAECQRLNTGGRVTFLGASEDIRRLYDAADGFVMSSQYEGLSVALLEAAAMGLPSVVTNVGGNAEVVIDGVTGYVVESGNSRKLAEAMRSIQDAPPELRHSFGLAAREHCVRNFRLETIVDRWVNLYSRYLLNSPVSELRERLQA